MSGGGHPAAGAAAAGYDAVVVLSFGGPEGPDDVLPFLENVTRGRGVPPERLREVAGHYHHVGGVSPINAHNRALRAALAAELAAHGPALPVYWGNRNWHPFLADTLARMRADGVRRALCFVTSAYGSYSACRQYLDDIAGARAAVGAGAPAVEKLRHYFDHPAFVAVHATALAAALATLPADRRATTRVLFTAHSIPTAMDDSAGPDGRLYSDQLRVAAGLVAAAAAPDVAWELVWQSRSGPPAVPWLGPDVDDRLRALPGDGVTDVAVSPLGFASDHLEVVWDLDVTAAGTAAGLGLGFARAATPGVDPRFVAMVRELVTERVDAAGVGRRLSAFCPSRPTCGAGCCPAPPGRRPPPGG